MTRKSCFGWAATIALSVAFSSIAFAQDQNASASTNNGTTTMSEPAMRKGGSTGRDLAISAAKSADHTILFRALRVSGLTEQAGSKGPYTVFAPTNEAFNKLPEGSIDEFWQPANKQKLIRILTAHVVKGNLKADQLQDGQKLKTVSGETLTVGKQGDDITLTDSKGNTANIVFADVEATNGTIHSIDTVLMPMK